jgi:hypothetical protein
MTDAIIVPQLSVHVVTGEAAADPWGQGFSSATAEVTTDDAGLIEMLSGAKHEQRMVVLSCARLDATGLITKADPTDGGTRFVLSVQDIRYRKRTPILEVHYRNPRLHLKT